MIKQSGSPLTPWVERLSNHFENTTYQLTSRDFKARFPEHQLDETSLLDFYQQATSAINELQGQEGFNDLTQPETHDGQINQYVELMALLKYVEQGDGHLTAEASDFDQLLRQPSENLECQLTASSAMKLCMTSSLKNLELF